MLKPYYTKPEHINLLDFEDIPKLTEEQGLDIPYLENDPTIFDFEEIVCDSEKQITQLHETLNRSQTAFQTTLVL